MFLTSIEERIGERWMRGHTCFVCVCVCLFWNIKRSRALVIDYLYGTASINRWNQSTLKILYAHFHSKTKKKEEQEQQQQWQHESFESEISKKMASKNIKMSNEIRSFSIRLPCVVTHERLRTWARSKLIYNFKFEICKSIVWKKEFAVFALSFFAPTKPCRTQ